MRTPLAACFVVAALSMGVAIPCASAASASSLRIVGTPKLVYWDQGSGKRSAVFQFQTNRRMRSNWNVRLNGINLTDVNRGGSGTCYSGQFWAETDVARNVYRLLRPGKLVTLNARSFKPSRQAHRGVRVQRATGPREASKLSEVACKT
jgi:hypothetical protein